MKNGLVVIALFLIIAFGCGQKSVKDSSLTIDEYQQLGMPDHTRIWNFQDYSMAYAALLKLKNEQPYALPVLSSEKSSEIFKRIINLENTSFLEDETLTLHERAYRIQGFINVQSDWIDIYTNIMMKEQFYDSELAQLHIFGLGVMHKMLELADKINKSDDPEDIKMRAAFSSIQMIYLIKVIGALDSQNLSDLYENADSEILSDSISSSIRRNLRWMNSAGKNDLKTAIRSVLESTDSEYVRKTYSELTKLL